MPHHLELHSRMHLYHVENIDYAKDKGQIIPIYR